MGKTDTLGYEKEVDQSDYTSCSLTVSVRTSNLLGWETGVCVCVVVGGGGGGHRHCGIQKRSGPVSCGLPSLVPVSLYLLLACCEMGARVSGCENR